MWDTTDYTARMDTTHESTGYSKSLRLVLKRAREARGLSAKEVGRRVAQRLQQLGDDEVGPISPSTIYAWEQFDRHPSISKYAAWARVLGYRLHVLLDDAGSTRAPVLVNSDEAAEAARRIDLLHPDARTAVLTVIRSMTGGETE